MTTLTELHNAWISTATSPAARRLWRTWTAAHPTLASFPDPVAAIESTKHKHPDPAPVLNTFLALSADHELAQLGIVQSFLPWMSRHIANHPVPPRDAEDQLAMLVAAFVAAAITLAHGAPYHWPATTIIHGTDSPLRRYYRRITNLPQPLGDTHDIDLTRLPIITSRTAVTHARSGEELVIAGLTQAVADQTISLTEANLVARVVAHGTTAAEQAPDLYMAKRTAQDRVRRIALHLADQAA